MIYLSEWGLSRVRQHKATPFTIHRQTDIILLAEWNYITNQSKSERKEVNNLWN